MLFLCCWYMDVTIIHTQTSVSARTSQKTQSVSIPKTNHDERSHMHVGLCVKCLLLLPGFNQVQVSTNVSKNSPKLQTD